MRKILQVSIAGWIAFCVACDNPTESKYSPYEQHPIAWPSLAKSPWPICRHDPQNTGRSSYPGAQSGIIVAKIPSYNSQAAIVTGPDSTLYFFHSIKGINYLQSADYTGNLKWSKQVAREPSTTPVVLYDGSIVTIGLETGEFTRLTTEGDTLWQCFIDVQWRFPWAVNPGVTVGLDTTIYYITCDRSLVAIGKNGELKWTLTDERLSADYDNLPAFSPDGKTLYCNGTNGVAIVAIDLATRSVKWTYGTITLNNSPVVDNQGNIFVFNGEPSGPILSDTCDFAFYSLNPSGILRWKYPLTRKYAYQKNPTIDWKGNVYFATDTLYSFTNDGELRWKISFKSALRVPLVCDSDNNIYYITDDENDDLRIYCINETGEMVWKIENSGERTRFGNTPIIITDSILLPGWRSEWVYVIH